MRRNVGVLSAAVVLTCAPFSIAGPPITCPTAVNSVQGNAIAIAHRTIEWHAGIGEVLSVQFTVMTKTDPVNDFQTISAPLIYWGDWPWAVVLDMNNRADRISYSCAVPLVTDDAQFLILLARYVIDSADSALRVYRKGDYSSEPVEDATPQKVEASTHMDGCALTRPIRNSSRIEACNWFFPRFISSSPRRSTWVDL